MASLARLDIDPEQLAAACRGDEAARADIYHLVAPATFGLIYRVTANRAGAEDLFQDTMLQMFQRLGDFRGLGTFGAWVRQIAVRHCLQYLRSPWQRARVWLAADDSDASLIPFGDTHAHADTGQADAADMLDAEALLRRLPATTRAVMWLYVVEGFSHDEIALQFSKTVSFSKSQVQRGLRILRDWQVPDAESEAGLTSSVATTAPRVRAGPAV